METNKASGAERIADMFSASMKEVVSMASGFVLSPTDDVTDAIYEYTALLSLKGRNIMLVVSCDSVSMRSLCSYMTGMTDDAITEHDLGDAVCELANMVAGNAKLRMSTEEEAFALGSVMLLRGDYMTLTTKKRTKKIPKFFAADNIRVMFELIF